MRFRATLAIFALALALGACGTTAATSAAIEVTDVWSRPALGMAGAQPDGTAMPAEAGMAAQPTGAAMASMDGPTGAVFLSIRNNSGAPDRLVKAESAVAGAVELHTATNEGRKMSMRPVDAIDIPAGGSVTLKPGGFHIMLIGLKRDLKVGDTFEVVLRFEKAGPITVQSHVRQPA